MVKIICPDGEERHIDDIYEVEYEHFPPVVIKALIAGRGKKRKRGNFCFELPRELFYFANKY